MIEIYRDTTESLYLTLESNAERVEPDGPVVITVTDKDTGMVVKTGTAVDNEFIYGRYDYTIPYELTSHDRKLEVEWSYSVNGGNRTKKDLVAVATPYVSIQEIQDELPELADKEAGEIATMERRVRMLINSYTGQNFGRWFGSLTVTGTGTGSLYISTPTLSVTQISPVRGSGRWDSDGMPISPNSPIVAPLNGYWNVKADAFYNYRFGAENRYVVTGWFGYDEVPAEISEAAKLLINDKFCKDSIYRDKGIGAVTSSDWRLDYNAAAFRGTGNLDVDRLLAPFVVVRMLVI